MPPFFFASHSGQYPVMSQLLTNYGDLKMSENSIFDTDFCGRLRKTGNIRAARLTRANLCSADQMDQQEKDNKLLTQEIENCRDSRDQARRKLDKISDALQDHIEAIVEEAIEEKMEAAKYDFDLSDHQSELESAIDERLDERLENVTLRIEN